MFHALGWIGAKGRVGALNAEPGPILLYSARTVGGSAYLAEDEDLLIQVPVDGVGVVEEVPQDLGVVGGGHDEGFLGPIVEDQLVGELAVLQVPLVAPVGVDVGDVAYPDGQLGVLLAQGQPPRGEVWTRIRLVAQLGREPGCCSDDRCDHPPNRRAERAFALAASSSRSFGGAAVSSEASNRSEILAISSTAE